MKKRILGLDLGTNSIGWALVEHDFKEKQGNILGMGSRIIPMSQDKLGDFGKGNSVSQTSERTGFRSARRLRERHLLRRERLHRVLNVLGFLPEHYASQIDFEKRLGQFIDDLEPKLAWGKNNDGKYEFLFQNSFKEMLADFKANGQDLKIPYDWTIYYLRKKALSQKLEKEELAWLILNFNQKRGYYQLRDEEEEENPNKLVEFYSLKVVDVKPEVKYNFTLENGASYYRMSEIPLQNWKDTHREFVVTTYLEKDGTPKKEKDGKDKQSFLLKDDLEIITKRSGKKSSSTKNISIKTEEKTIKIILVKEEKQEEVWYSLILENGWVYRRKSKTSLEDWKGKEKEFIVTTDLNDDESIKTDAEGEEKRSFRAPKEDDWTLVKKKTEQEIEQSKKTVGTYIYENLLQNPNQKIKGKLVRTIERKFYKEELKAILEKQIALQPQLFTEDLYNDCVRELYRSNEAQQMQLIKRDFVHLILNDIIFYQRPLKSQKSSIGNCSLEYRNFKDKEGNDKKLYLKAIPKSNPYYQEFRVWQWMYNLRIFTKKEDKDVTTEFVKTIEDLENLYEFLMAQKEVDHKAIIKYLLVSKDLKGKALNDEVAKYRWNYVYNAEKDESKKYPMNETGYEIKRRLGKVENVPSDFLTAEIEYHLWHIIYSITDKIEFEKALKKFANKYHLDEETFVENFKKFKPFPSDYGRYSEKAIRKLLPLMQIGKYWNWENIDQKTQNRIQNIITGEYDEKIKNRVREKAINLTEENHFQGLQLWLAQYIAYDRHSEADLAGKWNAVEDLEKYLQNFKQHSLRNPIVEQVITETLRVVKDIWKQYGNGAKDFFSEIHIELGREIKNPADERKRLTTMVTDNENTNLRVKAILTELLNDSSVGNVRPYSPTQQEAFKIYEDGILNSGVEIPDYVTDILKKFNESDAKKQPTKTEINRYKLWLEQKYHSPYTGQVIPLSKLFTPDYEIEHIIPQSRFFDDSFSNKVICESAVNKLKDNQLGLEFIKNHQGEKVPCGRGKVVEILSENEYKNFIEEKYSKNRTKKNKLLMDEIPDKMIERQMNDTRYISKFVSNLLSNIVREEKDDDGVNSKNLIPGNGKITTRLKQDWGLNDVWNELVLPRFERMNEITKTNNFTSKNKEGHSIPNIPLEFSKGFQKKRIDHRHHAVDALIIACATRDHSNLLNNQSAKSENSRYDLQHKLRNTEKWLDKEGKERTKFTEFKMPWKNFTVEAKDELKKIVISFKQNLRVINKATNSYQKIENGKKVQKKQEGTNWAIRKPMHQETVSGIVNLPWVKLGEGEITTATRERNDLVSLFNGIKTKEKAEAKIEKITNTGIQKILINYLESMDNLELAFSPEGIEDMNKNIAQYNNGKSHQPIFKVRTFEKGKGRFVLGEKGNKKQKYVQGAPNLFFAIYWDETKQKRTFETIPLNVVIERQKQGLSSVPEIDENSNKLLFCLSPNDLVYVPLEDEDISTIDFKNFSAEQKLRLYNVNDFSSTCYFTPNRLAKAIAPKEVDMSYDEKKNKITGSFDTKTASLDDAQIKDICIKLKVDRLGNISKP